MSYSTLVRRAHHPSSFSGLYWFLSLSKEFLSLSKDYPNKVVHVAENIQPSARGEYEITRACPERSRRACPERSRRACPERSRRVNQWFLRDGELKVQTLGRGFAWLDTGTHDYLSEASTFVEVIEKRWSSESRGKAVGELVEPCFDYAEPTNERAQYQACAPSIAEREGGKRS